MVQVTFDTKADSLEELQHALKLLQDAIAKRAKPALDMPAEPEEETALDTPFLKITVNKHEEHAHESSAHEEPAAALPGQKVPTLNELLSESLSDEDFSKMLKEQLAAEKPKERKAPDDDGYIEIVEYTEKE